MDKSDWAKAAFILAAVLIPLNASPLLLGPLFLWLKAWATRLYHRNARCRGISWPVRPTDPLRRSSFSPFLRRPALPDSSLPSSPAVAALAQVLYDIWGVASEPVAQPSYLDVRREYLRLDADFLLTLVLLHRSGFGSLNRAADPGSACTLTLGTVTLQLRVIDTQHARYTVGTVTGLADLDLTRIGDHGITKHDLLAVAEGFSPFYRHFIKSNSNVEISHPIQEMRDIHRAGWILAIGLSDTPPVKLYQTRQKPAYAEACSRTLEMLTLLQGEYAFHASRRRLLDSAVRVVTYMNGYTTGSGADTMAPELFDSTYRPLGRRLSAQQVRFALKLFNDYRQTPLSVDERKQLDGMLEDVVRAAVLGVFTWWQYVNNEGHEFPGWLLDDRVRLNPIWLTDG